MGAYFGSFGTILLYLLPIIIMLFLLNRMGKKRQEHEAKQRDAALVEGNWVLTRAGFYGRIVEIDGGVVVLETALGDESMWDINSVLVQKDPPVSPGSTLLNEPNETFLESDSENGSDYESE